MSMSVQDLPAATQEVVRYHQDRLAVYVPPQQRTIQWSEANDPTNWNPRYHPGYAEVIDDMAANCRKESVAAIDNIVAITVPDLTALKLTARLNTSLTNFKDQGLQRHLWIEAMKERWQ